MEAVVFLSLPLDVREGKAGVGLILHHVLSIKMRAWRIKGASQSGCKCGYPEPLGSSSYWSTEA
jgi:hypothetical protein